jgi:hypothetical protein
VHFLIKTLGRQAYLSINLKLPIENKFDNVNSNYFKTIKLHEDNLELIKLKKSKISKIELSYKSEYWLHGKILSIGYESSDAITKNVINSIK